MAAITTSERKGGKKTATATATAESSPYYTYVQAAAYCNVERTTLYRAMRGGRLRASGPGTAVRFHRDDLDLWMHSRSREK